MRVNQDSRTLKKGEWFVAVKGERHDGHLLINEALRRGAAGVLEVEELYALARKKIRSINPKIIAVTGSYGKTTTKEAIYKVLHSKMKGSRTKGNLNTPLGVALEVINGLKRHHQFFVAEVGMDRLEEIKKSCLVISPQIGVLTSVGEMHLEKLGSLERIKQAKSELLETLPPDGTAVLNLDDRSVREIAKGFAGRKIWYGFSPEASVNPSHLKGLRLKLLGKYNRYAALAAYAVGRIWGVSEEDSFQALARLRPQKGRLNLLSGKNGAKIIDDTYNAGPRSMKMALKVLAEIPARRRIAILGDMLELGGLEDQAHFDAVAHAFKVADVVVLRGGRMAHALNRFRRKCGTEGNVSSVDQIKLEEGDAVLVKGSQGMRMERVVQDFLKDKTRAPELLVRQDAGWVC
ncbi:MAG: UDP-N-acetylmuramoyl-tripeptide--D-alanyl-D-alanine ligase [Patescibacteria group bacterium]|nr:MAG: UDP-N-acetylmuramoyl-tripeptide--D-alanyl-D-alanine ligase [Patescibacteria group bacterium]